MVSRKLRIVIIGAGLGGLCMAKRLLDEGFDDFVILEQAEDVGGTWYSVRYPGCRCNTPAILYSFSFEINPNWSNVSATQPEILKYLQTIADKYGIRSHCRFGHTVTRAEWNDSTSTWMLSLDSGETIQADVIISAVGMFKEPRWPQIDGLNKFKGAIWHSAEWQSDHDLSHDKVAVIGSGDSAVQLIPEIIKLAPQVYLFQRTANYVLPRPEVFKLPTGELGLQGAPDYVLPMVNEPTMRKQYEDINANPQSYPKLYQELRADAEYTINAYVNRHDPRYQAAFETAGLAAIEVVEDPELRRKLRPAYPYGPRRSFFSNVYYQSFNEANLELVTTPITRIDEHSIVTNDNKARDVDTIILATGFEPPRFLATIDVVGRGGQHLAEAWQDGPIAYLGMMTAGFPNLFMLFGPNTYTGSVPVMIEAQADYILAHLDRLAKAGVASVDVQSSAMIRYDNYLQAAFNNLAPWEVSKAGSQRLWVGGNRHMWPYTIAEYRSLLTRIDPNNFDTAKV